MSIHWSHTYNIDLDGEKRHDVKIYSFSPKALLLETTTNFGKGFGKYFNEIEGQWNENLKMQDENVRSGWLFSIEKESQERLFSLLKRIHSGNVPPIMSSFKHSKDMKKLCSQIYGNLANIFDMAPEEKDSYTLSSDGGETIFYFNRDNEDPTKGECVIKVEKSRKKIEIYQYLYM